MRLNIIYVGLFIFFLFLLIPLSFSKSFIIANMSQPSQYFFVVNGTTGVTNIAGDLFHDSAIASDWIIRNVNQDASILFSVNYGGTFRNLLVLNGSDSTITLGYGDIMVIDAFGNVGIGTTSPTEKLDVAGSIKANNVRHYYLTRTFPFLPEEPEYSSIATYVDIGNFSIDKSGHNLDIAVTVSDPSFSVAKRYLITAQYCGDCTNLQWYKVAPISSTGEYSGGDYDNDFELLIRQDNTNHRISLRLLRTKGRTAGTAIIQIQQRGSINETLTESTAGGQMPIPSALWPTTVLTQVNSNVGIGTTSPSAKLDVNGTTELNGPVNVLSYGHTYFDYGSTHDIYLTYGSTGKTHFRTYDGSSYSEKVTIDSNGKVGINTTDPNTTLDVNGEITSDAVVLRSNAYVNCDDITTSNKGIIIYNSSANQFEACINDVWSAVELIPRGVKIRIYNSCSRSFSNFQVEVNVSDIIAKYGSTFALYTPYGSRVNYCFEQPNGECNSTYSNIDKIWIRLPVMYGNENTWLSVKDTNNNNAEDGGHVFDFYDAFNYEGEISSLWQFGNTKYGSINYTTTGGLLKTWSDDVNWRTMESSDEVIGVNDSVIVEARVLSEDADHWYIFCLTDKTYNGNKDRFCVVDPYYEGETIGMEIRENYSSSWPKEMYLKSVDRWFRIKIIKRSSNDFEVVMRKDEYGDVEEYRNQSLNFDSSHNWVIRQWKYNSTYDYWDYVLIRKFCDEQPIVETILE